MVQNLIPVGTIEWWDIAFPVVDTVAIDGWQFEVRRFESATCAMPQFNTIGQLLLAELVECAQSGPQITRYWPCRRCLQYVAYGEVRCITDRKHIFHFPYCGGCKCDNGRGVARALRGLEAARVLHWYFAPRPFADGVDKLSQALIKWGWELKGLPAIEEYLAIISSFGIKTMLAKKGG